MKQVSFGACNFWSKNFYVILLKGIVPEKTWGLFEWGTSGAEEGESSESLDALSEMRSQLAKKQACHYRLSCYETGAYTSTAQLLF